MNEKLSVFPRKKEALIERYVRLGKFEDNIGKEYGLR